MGLLVVSEIHQLVNGFNIQLLLSIILPTNRGLGYFYHLTFLNSDSFRLNYNRQIFSTNFFYPLFQSTENGKSIFQLNRVQFMFFTFRVIFSYGNGMGLMFIHLFWKNPSKIEMITSIFLTEIECNE